MDGASLDDQVIAWAFPRRDAGRRSAAPRAEVARRPAVLEWGAGARRRVDAAAVGATHPRRRRARNTSTPTSSTSSSSSGGSICRDHRATHRRAPSLVHRLRVATRRARTPSAHTRAARPVRQRRVAGRRRRRRQPTPLAELTAELDEIEAEASAFARTQPDDRFAISEGRRDHVLAPCGALVRRCATRQPQRGWSPICATT